MKAVLRFALLGSAFCAVMGAAGQVRAQTVLITGNKVAFTLGTTYRYGDTDFKVATCTAGSTSCSTDNLDIKAISNGRGGTQIDFVSASSSNIYSGTGSYGVTLALVVTPLPGSHGLSSITNTLSGSSKFTTGGAANNIADKGDLYSTVTGTTPGFAGLPSNLVSGGIMSSFTLQQSAASFNLKFDVTATTGQTLTLTNVALLFNPAPEPASIALFATGVAGLAAARRRFGRRAKAERSTKS